MIEENETREKRMQFDLETNKIENESQNDIERANMELEKNNMDE